MSEETRIEFKGDYVHVIQPKGYEINPEAMEEFYKTLAEFCKANNCYKILAECDSPVRKLKLHNAFSNADKLSSQLPLIKLACCFYNYQVNEISEFFKTAAFNRGVNVEFFNDKQKALEWLKS
ncbi:MAG: hypothetical protein ACP5T0_13855 [Verrucomicrobiia bacterium]